MFYRETRYSKGEVEGYAYMINGKETVYKDHYAVFNDLGDKGWELVATKQKGGNTSSYIFKRPK